MPFDRSRRVHGVSRKVERDAGGLRRQRVLRGPAVRSPGCQVVDARSVAAVDGAERDVAERVAIRRGLVTGDDHEVLDLGRLHGR